MIPYTSVCTESKSLFDKGVSALYPLAWRASGIFTGYSWLRRGFGVIVSHLMWQTTVWEKQIMRKVVPMTSSLTPAYRFIPHSFQAATDLPWFCTLLFVFPYYHSVWALDWSRQVRKYSKGKYIVEDQDKVLRAWRIMALALMHFQLWQESWGTFSSSFGSMGIKEMSWLACTRRVMEVSKMKCFFWVSCNRSIINGLLLLKWASFETRLPCILVPSKPYLESQEMGGRDALARSPLKRRMVPSPNV